MEAKTGGSNLSAEDGGTTQLALPADVHLL
jgi:hypothetical protein